MDNKDMPAMPVKGFADEKLNLFGQLHHGVTKREYFAGLAMQGILSNPIHKAPYTDTAKDCLEMADALLKELENEN